MRIRHESFLFGFSMKDLGAEAGKKLRLLLKMGKIKTRRSQR
jgi:hypothetical protein